MFYFPSKKKKKKYSNQNKLNIGMINFQCQWPQRQNLNRH